MEDEVVKTVDAGEEVKILELKDSFNYFDVEEYFAGMGSHKYTFFMILLPMILGALVGYHSSDSIFIGLIGAVLGLSIGYIISKKYRFEIYPEKDFPLTNDFYQNKKDELFKKLNTVDNISELYEYFQLNLKSYKCRNTSASSPFEDENKHYINNDAINLLGEIKEWLSKSDLLLPLSHTDLLTVNQLLNRFVNYENMSEDNREILKLELNTEKYPTSNEILKYIIQKNVSFEYLVELKNTILKYNIATYFDKEDLKEIYNLHFSKFNNMEEKVSSNILMDEFINFDNMNETNKQYIGTNFSKCAFLLNPEDVVKYLKKQKLEIDEFINLRECILNCMDQFESFSWDFLEDIIEKNVNIFIENDIEKFITHLEFILTIKSDDGSVTTELWDYIMPIYNILDKNPKAISEDNLHKIYNVGCNWEQVRLIFRDDRFNYFDKSRLLKFLAKQKNREDGCINSINQANSDTLKQLLNCNYVFGANSIYTAITCHEHNSNIDFSEKFNKILNDNWTDYSSLEIFLEEKVAHDIGNEAYRNLQSQISTLKTQEQLKADSEEVRRHTEEIKQSQLRSEEHARQERIASENAAENSYIAAQNSQRAAQNSQKAARNSQRAARDAKAARKNSQGRDDDNIFGIK